MPDGETDENGIEVNKTINITVDWYGSISASLYAPYTSINIDEFNSSSDKKIEFDFTLNDKKEQLLPKQNNIEIQIPEMFGNYPESVTCKNAGVSSEYDEEEHILTIEKRTGSYNNTYTIDLIYSDEVYDQISNGYTISIPITATFESYNNGNMNLENTENDEQGQATTKSQTTQTKNITFRTQVPVKKEAYEFSIQLLNKTYVTTPTKGYVISKQKITDAYNKAEPENMNYTVLWSVTRTELPASDDIGIIMKEDDNNYGERFNGNIEMSDYIKNTGIYFAENNFISQNGYISVYDDETDRLIKEFSYDEISQYNSPSNSYTYDEPIAHIRIETNKGNPNTNARINVYIIKEVDVEKIKENFTEAQIGNITSLRTSLKGELTNGATVSGYDECNLTSEKSYASIELSKNQIETTETTPVDQVISIEVPAKNASLADWQNGEFLVAISADALAYMEVTGVTSTYSGIQIPAYELIKENGMYLLKIVTNNDTPASGYTINIECKMLANPTFTGGSAIVELYSYNENCNTYHYSTIDRYDVNGNEITTDEKVGFSTNRLSILMPSSFITFETISNYNEKGEIAIAPNIAEVERKINSENGGSGSSQESSQGNNQESTQGNSQGSNQESAQGNTQESAQDGAGTAQININLINNYANSIENLIVIGEIPFEGNEINGTNLNSKFDTTMIKGIEIQDETQKQELKDAVKIYYSTKETPDTYNANTQNLEDYISDSANGWIEANEVTDVSIVKSYLIVLENYQINSGKSYTFSYQVKASDNAKLNDISYSNHMVSYEFITENGNLQPTTIIPNKVGLRVSSYYDFEVIKYKANTNEGRVVAGAKYKLTEISDENSITNTQNNQGNNEAGSGTENNQGNNEAGSGTENGNGTQNEGGNNTGNPQEDIEEISRIITSTSEGKLSLRNLRVNQIYSFKEIQAPNAYELSNKTIIFKVIENLNNELEFVKLSADDFDTAQTKIEKAVNGTYTLKSKVENTPKFALNITKVNSKNNNPIVGAIFEISETNDLTNGTKQVTDLNGNISIKNLNLNKSYTVKETYVNGFYELDDIQFTLTQDAEGDFSITSENTNFVEANIVNDENNDLIQMNVTLKDDEIPTYKLKIIKVSEDDETTLLPDARFSLTKTDLNKIEYYSTDENGEIEITGLYEYVEEKEDKITGKYKLKEIQEPTGYINNKEEIIFVASKNEKNELEIQIENKENLKTVKEISVDEDIITIIIQDKPLFKLTKVDKDTGEPLKNAEFVIYSLNDNGEVVDYAKAPNGDYIGRKNANGLYIVTTDEKGEITLALGAGSYKIIESAFPEGYEELQYSETFIVSGNSMPNPDFLVTPDQDIESAENENAVDEHEETTKELEIYTIEDLLDFSYAVTSGENDYSDTRVLLMNDLDFNSEDPNDESYENATEIYVGQSESGDWNEDDTPESVKTEMTTGKGFPSIGIYSATEGDAHAFSGIFDGQNHEIKNLYINNSEKGSNGLFGYANGATIVNLTVSGNLNAGYALGGICGWAGNKIYIENCTNKCTINGGSNVGGILGYFNNGSNVGIVSCKNEGSITGSYEVGGILGYAYGISGTMNMTKCANTGTISASSTCGGICGETLNCSKIVLKELNNSGVVSGTSQCGGIVGYMYYGDTLIAEDLVNSANINSTESSNYSSVQNGGICGHISGIGKVSMNKITNTGEVSANGSTIGGIIGCAENGTYLISEMKNSSDVTGGGYVGGCIGTMSQGAYIRIRDSSNEGKIISSGDAGGLICNRNTPTAFIENCFNTGDITHDAQAGGIIGHDYNSIQINNCYNKGNIIKSNSSGNGYGGGIIGYTSTSNSSSSRIIANSYNTGDVIGGSEVGGIVGEFDSNYTSKIYNCYNTGTVEGTTYVGGTIGHSNANIDILYTFNNGTIRTATPDNSYTREVGGLVGLATHETNFDNCSNSGNIVNNTTNSNSIIFGGIIGYNNGSGTITNSYNDGDIINTGPCSDTIIGGIAGNLYGDYANISILNCYNKGSLYNYNGGSAKIGGILATGREVEEIKACYNSGNIFNINSGGADIGGIAGISSFKISNCYNIGNIDNNYYQSNVHYVGGINGSGNNSEYCYNIGSIYDKNLGTSTNTQYVNPIQGTSLQIENTYYPDTIEIFSESMNMQSILNNSVTEEYMKSEEFYNILKEQNSKWKYLEGQYPILDIAVLNNSIEALKLTIENTKKEFDITTEIGKNSSGERTGGTISGSYGGIYTAANNIKYVETVKYDEANETAIEIVPVNENYKIQSIKINGENIEFSPEEDGSYTISEGDLKNIKSNYRVMATFSENNEVLTINKTDENGNKLKGAKFRIDSDNLQVTNEIRDLTKNNDSYYFIEKEDGTLTTNNVTTANTVANSYYVLDLRGRTGECRVAINAYVNVAGGTVYVGISETTDVLQYDDDNNFFKEGYASGTKENISELLQGGKIYYLHLGYVCRNSYSWQEIRINSIDIISNEENHNITVERYNSEYFENEDGVYVPTNIGSSDTTANSIVKIDLTDKKENYIVKINYNTSNTGILYATVKNDNYPEAAIYDNDFLYAYKEEGDAYSKIIKGGQQYYLLLGFTSKNNDDSPVQINDISLIKQENALFVETNKNGQAIIDAQEGEYKITEVEAPEGYILDNTSKTYTVESDKDNIVNFENTKMKEVIVHYYLKETGSEYNTDPIELQEDAHIYGKLGDKYNTSEYINFELQGYSLQMDNNDEYIIPSNASGTFEADVTDVYYYYEDRENKTIDIQAKKQWKMTDNDAQEYRVTLQLIKKLEDKETPAVDENGVEITKTIRGNSRTIFENLKAYENDEKIKYKVKEIKVEKLVSINEETQIENWETVPLNQFNITYTNE